MTRSNIRKISIGSDYKNDAMHYSVGQSVYGGHIISCILPNENDGLHIMKFINASVKSSNNNSIWTDLSSI